MSSFYETRRAAVNLSEKIEILLEKNRANFSVDDVETLNEVQEYLHQIKKGKSPNLMLADMTIRGIEIVTRLMGFLEFLD